MVRKSKSLAFSYVNHDTSNKNFLHKNFDKVKCYHSNFYKSKFTNVSFRELLLNGVLLLMPLFINVHSRGRVLKVVQLVSPCLNSVFLMTWN